MAFDSVRETLVLVDECEDKDKGNDVEEKSDYCESHTFSHVQTSNTLENVSEIKKEFKIKKLMKFSGDVDIRKKSSFWLQGDQYKLKKPFDYKKYTNFELIKKFLFLWNDGIAFFAPMADHKLPRLLGRKPGWLDKFRNCRNLVKYGLSFVIICIVIST